MKRRMEAETDIRLGRAGDDRVVVYRMVPDVALAVAAVLLKEGLLKGDSGFEADARNLQRLAALAEEVPA